MSKEPEKPRAMGQQRTEADQYLSDLGGSFAGFRDHIRASVVSACDAEIKQAVQNLTFQFESLANRSFRTELRHFHEPGQTTIGSRYKNAEIEYKRTLNSILAVTLLTPASEGDVAKSEADPRYRLFTNLQKGNKLTLPHFVDLQKLMLRACPDNEHLGLLMTILTSHDLAKLGTVAKRITEVSGIASINHDLLLSQLTRIPALYEEILPAFAKLPEAYKEKARVVMDSGFNRGQFAQAECTPLQLSVLTPDKIDENGLALIRAEGTADLAGVTGTLGMVMNENVFFVYQTADDAVDWMRSGHSETEAYIYMLQERLNRAHIDTHLTPSDFTTKNGQEHIALARIATLVQADNAEYRQIQDSYGRLGPVPQMQLTESLSRSGFDGRIAYMFYYLPAMYEIILKQETDHDPVNGKTFGLERAMRLNAHLGMLAEQFLQDSTSAGNSPVLIERTDAGVNKSVPFSEVGKRGFQTQEAEFVFGLDRIVKLLQTNYAAFAVPENALEAFIDVTA